MDRKKIYYIGHPKTISLFSDYLNKAKKSVGLSEEVTLSGISSPNALLGAIERVEPSALFIHAHEDYGFSVLNRLYNSGRNFPAYVVGTGHVPDKGKRMHYPAILIRFSDIRTYHARLEKALLDVCHDCLSREKFDEHKKRLVEILGDWENESLIKDNDPYKKINHHTPLNGRRMRENGCDNHNIEPCVDFREMANEIFARRRGHKKLGMGI